MPPGHYSIAHDADTKPSCNFLNRTPAQPQIPQPTTQNRVDYSIPPTQIIHGLISHNHVANNIFFKRDPSSWGLSFHGKSKDPPVENFLFRVESMATEVFHVPLDSIVN